MRTVRTVRMELPRMRRREAQRGAEGRRRQRQIWPLFVSVKCKRKEKGATEGATERVMWNVADTRRLQTALLNQNVLNARPITIQVAPENVQSHARSGNNPLVWNVPTSNLANVSNNPNNPNNAYKNRSESSGQSVNRFALSSAIVLGSAVCLWVLLFVLVGAFYFNVSQTTTAFKQELRPHIEEALQHMSNVLNHMDRAATSADHMLSDADALEHSIVPAVAHAVNDSASVLHKLETIAQNPVLKLSLSN